MKTQKIQTLKTLSVVMAGLIVGSLSCNAGAAGMANTENGAQMIYQSHSINHSIYSYVGRTLGKVSVDPQLIYVSQAYSPAIHSYVHSGSEQAVPWNVEYVNTAYNPAIYSYEGHQVNGKVKVLPIEVID